MSAKRATSYELGRQNLPIDDELDSRWNTLKGETMVKQMVRFRFGSKVIADQVRVFLRQMPDAAGILISQTDNELELSGEDDLILLASDVSNKHGGALVEKLSQSQILARIKLLQDEIGEAQGKLRDFQSHLRALDPNTEAVQIGNVSMGIRVAKEAIAEREAVIQKLQQHATQR